MSGSPGVRLAPDLPDGPRMALVVATSRYEDPELSQLRAPAHDANDLAQVLGDPGVGAFTVTQLIDADERQVRRAIGAFLSGRGIGDLVVVYLSCHGVLDRRNRLYFAASDTLKTQLGATGIPAAWLMDELEDCRARTKVLILDCCFSGAFAHGSKKGDADLDLERRLAGHGRGQAVLTASRAGEYSFEGQALPGAASAGSVFTAGLVEGLRTGAADISGDGYVSVDEAFDYAFGYVQSSGVGQTPQRWLYGGEGEIMLARSPAGIVTTGPLPEDTLGVRNAPDRAVRILTAAEYMVPSINSKETRARLLAQIAKGLAAADPDRAAGLLADAERTARSIANKYSRVCALAEIAKTLAATDPDRAPGLLADAERFARSSTDPSVTAKALVVIAKAVAATDPDRAAGLLADAERSAQSITAEPSPQRITDESLKGEVLVEIVKAVAATDPDGAQRIANSITSSSLKAFALAVIAETLVATDPDRAARFVAAAERIARYGGGPWIDTVIVEVTKALAAIDPDRAEDYIQAQSTKITQDWLAHARAYIAGALAAINPDRAERYAKTITLSRRDYAYAEMAEVLATTDPDRAERYAQSIREPYWKAKALIAIAEI